LGEGRVGGQRGRDEGAFDEPFYQSRKPPKKRSEERVEHGFEVAQGSVDWFDHEQKASPNASLRDEEEFGPSSGTFTRQSIGVRE
jgi:hypothetical protein